MRRAGKAALAALCAFAALFAWRPIDADDARRALLLRAAGVARVKSAGLRAYERADCAPGAACRCVALIHGLGDSALTWDKFLRHDALAGAFAWAPELPGSEGSDAPPDAAGYGARAMGRTLADAMSARCPRWTVVGNSLGGWIASWIALDRPELVERLVLLNPGGMTDPTGAALETARVLAAPTVAALRDFDGKARAGTRSVPDRILAMVAERISSRPTAAMVAAFRPEDALDARARDLKVPTLILWGEADRLIDVGTVERLVKLAPRAELRRIPACGHLPQQECPEKAAEASLRP